MATTQRSQVAFASQPSRSSPGIAAALPLDLDDVIPGPHYQICHSRVVRASLPAVWDVLHRVTMSALPLGRALEGMRVLPAPGCPAASPGRWPAAAFST